MDVLFGSVGVAQREKERWDEVHAEVGLNEILARSGSIVAPPAYSSDAGEKEVAAKSEKPTVTETTQA